MGIVTRAPKRDELAPDGWGQIDLASAGPGGRTTVAMHVEAIRRGCWRKVAP